jgi:hypothetical protein
VSILSTTLYVEYTYHQRSQTLFEREYSWAFSREQRNNAARRSGRGSETTNYSLRVLEFK